jgi:myo-inositol-1(or 4)-monophosphatase
VPAAPQLDAIEAIARDAGALLSGRFGDPGLIEVKGSSSTGRRVTDLVTELDHASEKMIVERIAAIAPGAAVHAEEDGVRYVDGTLVDVPLDELEDLWLVDPLDGTVNFAHGIPMFCVSIARYSFGVPKAGVVYAPMLNELYAFEGDNTLPTLNGQPLKIAEGVRPGQGVASLSGVGPHFRELARNFTSWRRIGSAALTLCWIAAGRLDAYVQLGTLWAWDHAAAVPMIVLAGGVVTDHRGEPWAYPLDGTTGLVAGAAGPHGICCDVLRDLRVM